MAITTGEVRWRGCGEDCLGDSSPLKDGTAGRAAPAVSSRWLRFFSGGARDGRGGGRDGALGEGWAARATGALPMLSFR